MDTSPDYIYFKDRNSSFIMVNRATAKALGCKDPADAIGKSDFDFLPDIAEQTREDEVHILETGEPQIDKSLCVRFADGLDHWISITKTPIKDNQGTIVGIMGISRDITKRVSLEKSLNECTTIHKHVFDASPNCMYIKDKDGRYIIANKTIADLYQTTPAKMIGKTDADFANQAVLRPAEATFFIDTDLKTIQTKEKQVVPLEPFTWNDGTTHYFHTTKVPIRYEDDDSCVLGISVDITDVKIADEKLRMQQTLLNLAFNSSPGLFALKSPNGVYQLVNKGFCDFLGKNSDEIIGKTDFELFPVDEAEAYRKGDFEVMETGKPERDEWQVTGAKGNKKWLDVTKTAVYNDSGECTGVLCSIVDITKRKQSEAALSESKIKLLESNQILSGVLEHTWMMAVYLDNQFNFIWVNRAYAETCKHDPAFFRGKNHFDLYPHAENKKIFQQVVDSGKPFFVKAKPFDFSDQPERGVTYWDWSLVPIKENGIKVTGLVFTLAEVTDSIRARHSLKISEERFRNLFETITSGVAVYEAVDNGDDYIFKDFNTAAEKIENIKREELIGKRVSEVFPGVKDFGIFKVFQRVYKTGNSEFFPEGIYKDDRTPESWRENWVYKLPSGEIVAVYDDVTDRKEKDNALRESEEKYRNLFANMEQGVFYQKADGRFVDVNDKGLEMFGLTREEFLRRDSLDLNWDVVTEDGLPVPGEQHPSMVALKTGKPVYDTIFGVYSPRKEDYVWMTVNAIPQFKEGETSPYQVFLTMHDITALKNTMERLEESEQKLRSLVNVSSEWIWQVDKNAVFEYVGDSVKDVIGYDPSEIIGKTPFDFMDDDEQKKIGGIFEKIVEQKGKIVKLQERLRHKNNENIFFETDGIPLLDKNGDLTGYFGIYRNVTNRKRYEELLTNERNKLTSIFDGIDEAIYVADTETHELLYMNDAIKKNWDGRIGEKCYKVLQNRDSTCPFCTNYKLIKNPDKPYIWEFQNETNNEWYRCIDRLIPWVNNKMVRLEIAINITDLKNIQKEIADKNEELDSRNKELHKAQDQLKELNKNLEAIVQERTQDLEKVLKLKDDFINQLGHDLKNPLGPMVNLLPILETRSNNKDDKEIFAVINRNVDYIRNLVKKTLELAQLNSPSFNLNREETMLHKEVEYIISMQKSFVDHHRINVTNLVPKNVKVSVDKMSFKELLINLLNNAVKYSSDGGTITIDAAKQDDAAVIVSMTDSGIGMTEEQIPHLFDEFYKVDGSRHDFNSSGLGLSICKKIVEKHGGRIWAESKGLGKGSTFYFMMPTDDSVNQRK